MKSLLLYYNNKTKIHQRTRRSNVLGNLKNNRTQLNSHPAIKQKQENKQLRPTNLPNLRLNQLTWTDQ